MEKRLQRKLKKIHAVAEENNANRHAHQHAENDRDAHEAAMVEHMATKAKKRALAVGATKMEGEAAVERVAITVLLAAGDAIPMTD